MLERRAFLRGLVSLPLIGGGVTLIGRPAAAVPLIQAAALTDLGDARQRARYAWAAFAGAMDEIAIGADGWRVMGGRVRPLGPYQGSDFVRPVMVRLSQPYLPTSQMSVDEHEDFEL